MKFDTYFKLTSYVVVACGALALLVTGGIGLVIGSVFAALAVAAWYLEGKRWQISERLSLALILLSLPLFYFDWQYQAANLARERAGATTLAHLILSLSVIKLLQKKIDRDWVFLYLISFFEVLLSAGLSISPTFLAVLTVYLLFSACAIVAFEMLKSERDIKVLKIVSTRRRKTSKQNNIVWRLPIAAASVLILITVLAVPLFFIMPRAGGAGIGSGGGSRVSSFSGFSDSVELGKIGQIQQNNEVVMRVRVDEASAPRNQNLRWRGIALDTFDNAGWRNSKRNDPKTAVTKDDNGIFRLNTAKRGVKPTIQNVYLEPIDAAMLFAAGRVIGIQGNFSVITRDEEFTPYLSRNYNRISYRAFSDVSAPDDDVLRADNEIYAKEYERFLQLPKRIDSRIKRLAEQIIEKSGADNRYDAARAIENYLQTNYGYTLDLKAGGSEPLAEFLFNHREGHCEYFSTALAVMLRTQGIAARVVNGFQTGTYNDAADAYIVTQREAHSWVEVYFPETDSWVTFDATPASGRNLSERDAAGNILYAQFNKYAEAMQMFWLQYVVGYDNQEQLGLARSLRNNLMQNQERLGDFWTKLQEQASEWWKTIRGDNGTAASFQVLAQTVLWLVLVTVIFGSWFLLKRFGRGDFWQRFNLRRRAGSTKIIEFYERMTKALDRRGVRRQSQQTPLEFATGLAMPEALQITEAYHRVRFGEEVLTRKEALNIENWLKNLEKPSK